MADQDIRLAAARARVEARRRAGIVKLQKFCEWEPCKKEFVGCRDEQRFCSYSCSAKATQAKLGRVKLSKICKRCGESFTPGIAKQVYCSRDCFAHSLRLRSLRKEAKSNRVCANLECGKVFTGGRRFCSKRCQGYVCDKKYGINRRPFVSEDVKRNCVACKADISHRHINSVYCSKECQLEYTREVRNAKRRDYEKTPEFRARRKEYELRNEDSRRKYQKAYQKKHIDRDKVTRFKARIKRNYGYDLASLPPKPSKCENPFCKGVKVVFEHNHETGAFRGWVCQRCNSVMGNALDSSAYLRWLADYLETRG